MSLCTEEKQAGGSAHIVGRHSAAVGAWLQIAPVDDRQFCEASKSKSRTIATLEVKAQEPAIQAGCGKPAQRDIDWCHEDAPVMADDFVKLHVKSTIESSVPPIFAQTRIQLASASSECTLKDNDGADDTAMLMEEDETDARSRASSDSSNPDTDPGVQDIPRSNTSSPSPTQASPQTTPRGSGVRPRSHSFSSAGNKHGTTEEGRCEETPTREISTQLSALRFQGSVPLPVACAAKHHCDCIQWQDLHRRIMEAQEAQEAQAAGLVSLQNQVQTLVATTQDLVKNIPGPVRCGRIHGDHKLLLCIICEQQPRTKVFPCGHFLCCSLCGPKVVDMNRCCPVCRRPASQDGLLTIFQS